ncbi:DUF305 domain-containing protein [Nonomuraea sp. NBC_01738]|uniref:DUF305 domain-containing protein n=1 Tax=Nonomuraea sp. NBC_01738 TaxID=2976003 RepID=UPI002E14AC2F|nr:DUF305 domain-containing protein [Nonomuraea sp. NBC_01738]
MLSNKFKITVTVAALAFAAAACGGGAATDAGSTASGPTASSSGHDMSAMSPTTPAGAAFNDADVMFAQMMIPHHEQAVEMAELAESRASDQEIKDLAAKIKGAQDPEIQTMKSWLTAWGKPVPSGGMNHDMPGIMSASEMKELEAAKGAAFDRKFAKMMIAHHKGAVDMARTEQRDGTNPEAVALAKAIETAQQEEIAQMEKLLARL